MFHANLREHVSREFARKPRGLAELDRMKATKFRQFLLYTGIIVLHKVVARSCVRAFLALLHGHSSSWNAKSEIRTQQIRKTIAENIYY